MKSAFRLIRLMLPCVLLAVFWAPPESAADACDTACETDYATCTDNCQDSLCYVNCNRQLDRCYCSCHPEEECV
jgi:hypothetical protein